MLHIADCGATTHDNDDRDCLDGDNCQWNGWHTVTVQHCANHTACCVQVTKRSVVSFSIIDSV
jgi:hypothetical protein